MQSTPQKGSKKDMKSDASIEKTDGCAPQKSSDALFMEAVQSCVEDYCLVRQVREMMFAKYGLTKGGTASTADHEVDEEGSPLAPLSLENVRSMERYSDDMLAEEALMILETHYEMDEKAFFNIFKKTQLFQKFVEAIHDEIYPHTSAEAAR